MPVLGLHPTSGMPGIQFGLRPDMSAHGGRSNSPSSRGDCEECVRMRARGHRNAREPKYCQRHQCDHKDASGIMCIKRKKAADPRCTAHTQCQARGCHDRAVDARGIVSEYCQNHTCLVDDCDEGRVHDPNTGVYDDLCSNHLSKVCRIPHCIEWQTDHGNFCEHHTCVIEDCDVKSLIEGGRPFCVEHNKCTVAGCQKPKCQFGNGFESVCRDHYVAPCRVETCDKKSCPATRFCDLHSCRYSNQERCKKEARPGRGKPYCDDHRCSDHDCQILRSFSEVEGSLRMNAFCPLHECKEKTCVKHAIPDKPYCNSHCCTKEGCKSARDNDPRFETLCFTHHEERIAKRAIDEQLAAMRLREQEAANARAQEARRREEQRRERRPPPAEPGRPAYSPPRQRFGRQEGLRPRARFDNDHDDEGYRSHRSSGESFGPVDGW